MDTKTKIILDIHTISDTDRVETNVLMEGDCAKQDVFHAAMKMLTLAGAIAPVDYEQAVNQIAKLAIEKGPSEELLVYY